MTATTHKKRYKTQDENYFYPGNQIALTFASDLDREFTASILKQDLDLITLLIELRDAGLMAFDGNILTFKCWLDTYVPVLGSKPNDLLGRPGGIERVHTLLLQMEFGIVP